MYIYSFFNTFIHHTDIPGVRETDGAQYVCWRHEGGAHPKDDDDWWLDLYVMLSRATRLDDILLTRAPPASFLLKGPPKMLRQQLESFAARTEECRQTAKELAAELGFNLFLRGC